MEKYTEIEKIYEDIQNLNIQGATNVAIATFEGMKLYVSISNQADPQLFYNEFIEVGNKLANARVNEPLATNGVKYVKYFFGQSFSDLPNLNTMKRELVSLCDKYLDIIASSKRELVEKNKNLLTNLDKVFTHCHSSTAVALIQALGKNDHNFEAVCTETRPLFQGRKTAQNLLNAGIKTTLIADSAGESFIVNRGSVSIDVVFIGCDQIMTKGHAINKIGSWGMGMAAHYADKPFYVVTPLLKYCKDSQHHDVEIEVRESKELWEDAPKGLHMFNPAFEIIDNVLITGYVTEFGIVKPKDIEALVKEKYPWLFLD